jgi:nucleotide sugar dehydrogenase
MNTFIVVVGLGYVGLPLALRAEQKGLNVVGFDINAGLIKALNSHNNPLHDEKISEALGRTQINFTTEEDAISLAEIVVICVPTPVDKNHNPNLRPVVLATETVGKKLKPGQLIVLESTVNPGVTDDVVIPILEEKSGLRAGQDFYVAHCPERINPGDKKWHVGNIPRVVGGYDETSLRRAEDFYASIIEAEIRPMKSLKEAEAVKIVENSFRDVNIAFVNELARSFDVLGIDVVSVIDGASTKPFAFMPHYPGLGVGGHCIPVDPYYLIENAKRVGFSHDFLSLARRINNDMPSFVLNLLNDALNDIELPLKGTPVTLLGLSYKPGVGDLRESPALILLKLLEDKGVKVTVFDPYLPAKSSASDLSSALKNAQAVVLATAHPEFKKISFNQLEDGGTRVFIDGRNMFARHKPKIKKMHYRGVGV